MWAEIKKEWEIDGVKKSSWACVGNIFDNPYYDKEVVPTINKYEEEGEPYHDNSPKVAHPYDERNYDLYSILADVRNGYGFAGSDTGEGFKVIRGYSQDHLRGLPEDVSRYVKWISDDYGSDGHSHRHVGRHRSDRSLGN